MLAAFLRSVIVVELIRFYLSFYIVTHAGIAAGVSRAFSHVCLPVCPRSKRKTV